MKSEDCVAVDKGDNGCCYWYGIAVGMDSRERRQSPRTGGQRAEHVLSLDEMVDCRLGTDETRSLSEKAYPIGP